MKQTTLADLAHLMATRKPRSPASLPLDVGAPEDAAPAPAPARKPAAAPKAPRAPKPPAAPRAKKAARVPTLVEALSSFLAGPLVADLEQRAQAPSVERMLRKQWEQERAQNRSADHYEGFRRRTCLQVGASWLLCCVFVRTLEDRHLLERRRLAGEGAEDSEHLFFEQFPSLGHRDYLLAVFREVGKLPGASSVLGVGQAPAYRLAPSSPVARELLKLFRGIDDATGALLYRFEGQDTRALGDLYQDLSDDIRERYALLQTPDFVEEFILDLTLSPAIDTFGLEQVRLIDPTCGSGHFLLGAFHRLVERHRAHSPGLSGLQIASRALDQIHGVDLNPYAIAIARFRLTLAFVQVAGIKRLREISAPLPLHLVVADSLLIAARKSTRRLGEVAPDAGFNDRMFDLEDHERAYQILGQGYHAVVGNPPYITCKDSALREEYRGLYDSAAGKFALAAPFTERFFQLATSGGFVGLINANSFMKREFGKKLIEEVLPHLNLTHVLDTSGAYIPGHGTPTVILAGRNQAPIGDTVRAVLGKRGEPSTPDNPERGLVWMSIAEHFSAAEFENDFISVVNVDRKTFTKHPWSLGGGGAAELKESLEQRAEKRLKHVTQSIGFMSISGEDDAFVAPFSVFARHLLPSATFGYGEVVRDWSISPEMHVLLPYNIDWAPSISSGVEKWLWPYRAGLCERLMFGKTQKQAGLSWFEYRHLAREKLRTPLSITFAEVATHNHFVLDRGGKVFKQTAPIIKLPAGATEDDHLALLGYLNSSTACFWMKQVCHKKSSASQKHHADPARAAFQFSGTALSSMPIPDFDQKRPWLVEFARQLLAEGASRSEWLSGGKLKDSLRAALGTRADLEIMIRDGWENFDRSTRRSCFLQEEIDWLIYSLFGFVESMAADGSFDKESEAELGSRPFEFSSGYVSGVSERASATDRKIATSQPQGWKERAPLLQSNELSLIETREFKRQWRDTEINIDQDEFRSNVQRSWMIDFVRDYAESVVKESPNTTTLDHLINTILGGDLRETFQAIADFLALDVRELIRAALSHEEVPYLAAYRYSEAGLAKRRAWEETWALQRREDAGEKVEIPVPPKYDSKDYRRAEYWSLRGKLDVPKERFISYPGAEDEQGGLVLGWAGWDHLQRATALAGLYQERKDQQGWEGPRLVPLLAGLWELVPWLKQWHNEPSEEFQGERLGDYFAAFVVEEARQWGKTTADLEAWRPGK